MCGIFASLNNSSINIDELKEWFNKIQHRGPDMSKFIEVDDKVNLGFHRLKINDVTENGMQPFELDNLYLVANAEIFNHKEIETRYAFKMQSKSDCEVILHLYKHHQGDVEKVCKDLQDSEFAFILYDANIGELYVARDIFGIRPLFYGFNDDKSIFVASELKAINFCMSVRPFPPATYALLQDGKLIPTLYYNIPCETIDSPYTLEKIHSNINKILRKSIKDRTMSERPVGAFLSGGLDSSLVVALLSEQIPDLNCFSIGLNHDSLDIIAAKKVVAHLNSKGCNIKHHIITYTVEEGFNALRDVIYHLESWDTTTIRASIPQYLLSKWIKENTDIRVLYSGEFADELFAGYLYSMLAPNASELEDDSRRLLQEIYLYDALRVDRTTASQGLEVRIPFGSKHLIDYIFALPPELRSCSSQILEKTLLRQAFQNDDLLPDTILWRKKMAFSDAVSSKELSWYKTLVEQYINPLVLVGNQEPTSTKESTYYRSIFNELFPNRYDIIPRLWLPKWIDMNGEPSATELPCYTNE